MAVLYPDNLGHNNPTKALLDDSQLRGAAVSVADAAARNAIPEDKRKQGMIVTYVSGVDMITKRYSNSDIGNVAWATESNWEEIGGAGSYPFDQDLNTTDNVSFKSISTNRDIVNDPIVFYIEVGGSDLNDGLSIENAFASLKPIIKYVQTIHFTDTLTINFGAGNFQIDEDLQRLAEKSSGNGELSIKGAWTEVVSDVDLVSVPANDPFTYTVTVGGNTPSWVEDQYDTYAFGSNKIPVTGNTASTLSLSDRGQTSTDAIYQRASILNIDALEDNYVIRGINLIRFTIEEGIDLVVSNCSSFRVYSGASLRIENGARIKTDKFFEIFQGSQLFVVRGIIEVDNNSISQYPSTYMAMQAVYIRGRFVQLPESYAFLLDAVIKNVNGDNAAFRLNGQVQLSAGSIKFIDFNTAFEVREGGLMASSLSNLIVFDNVNYLFNILTDRGANVVINSAQIPITPAIGNYQTQPSYFVRDALSYKIYVDGSDIPDDSPTFEQVTSPTLVFSGDGGSASYINGSSNAVNIYRDGSKIVELTDFISNINTSVLNLNQGVVYFKGITDTSTIMSVSESGVSMNKDLSLQDSFRCGFTIDSGHYQNNINLSLVLGGPDLSGISGSVNTVIGNGSGKSLGTGSGNILIGQLTGRSIDEGSSNLLIGHSLGNQITSGSENIIISTSNLFNNLTAGNGNILIGGDQSVSSNISDVFSVGSSDSLRISHSLLIGTFNATAANQTFDINAKTTIQNNLVLSSITSGSGTQGELRNNAGVLEFYDGSSWRIVNLT